MMRRRELPTCKGKSGIRKDKKWQSWEEENYQPAKENGTHKQRQSQGLSIIHIKKFKSPTSALSLLPIAALLFWFSWFTAEAKASSLRLSLLTFEALIKWLLWLWLVFGFIRELYNSFNLIIGHDCLKFMICCSEHLPGNPSHCLVNFFLHLLPRGSSIIVSSCTAWGMGGGVSCYTAWRDRRCGLRVLWQEANQQQKGKQMTNFHWKL